MVYEPTTNFKDSNGVDLGKKLITQDYVATVYPSLSGSASGFIAGSDMWVWGNNTTSVHGNNGSGATRSTPSRQWLESVNWKQIVNVSGSPGNTVLATKTDGTLWAWGGNASGQIGDNTNATRSTPRQISIAAAGGLTGWKTLIGGGNAQFLAIREDGTLWSWGSNAQGQLGDNTTTTRSTPRQISAGATRITGWRTGHSGFLMSFAIHEDGTLWGTGYNFYGSLGNNSTVNRLTLTQEATSSTNWKQVVVNGNNTTIGLKKDGTIWCWGSAASGQLGNNTNDGGTTGVNSRSSPIREFTSSTNWKSLCSNSSGPSGFVMAIKTNGTLWGWGNNASGQLGLGPADATTRSTPSAEFTASTNWKSVTCGDSQTLAIKTDGTLWGWGANNFGQIGVNDIITRATARQESTLSTNWYQVCTGYRSSLGIQITFKQ